MREGAHGAERWWGEAPELPRKSRRDCDAERLMDTLVQRARRAASMMCQDPTRLVGRKTRRAQETVSSVRLLRAGFEPFRACANPLGYRDAQNRWQDGE